MDLKCKNCGSEDLFFVHQQEVKEVCCKDCSETVFQISRKYRFPSHGQFGSLKDKTHKKEQDGETRHD